MPNFWGWVKTESRANNWVKFKQLSQIDSKDGFDSKHWAIFFLSVSETVDSIDINSIEL